MESTPNCLRCETGTVPANAEVGLCEKCFDEEFPEGLSKDESAHCNYCGQPREWGAMISTGGGDMCADCQAGFSELQ
jgi:hypothetical protein